MRGRGGGQTGSAKKLALSAAGEGKQWGFFIPGENQDQICILEGSTSSSQEASEEREAGGHVGGSCSCSSERWQGLSQVENNREGSQQDLEVNWMQVLGRRGVRVTTGSSQGPAGSLQLGGTES